MKLCTDYFKVCGKLRGLETITESFAQRSAQSILLSLGPMQKLISNSFTLKRLMTNVKLKFRFIVTSFTTLEFIKPQAYSKV